MARFLIALSLAILLGSTAATAQAVTRTGYLSDILCINRRTALDGADMLLRPQDHSVHCNLLTVCIVTGYTILEAPASATPTHYGTLWNLTGAANTRAVTFLRTLPTSRKNVLVAATGTMSGFLFDAEEFTMIGSGARFFSSVAALVVAAAAFMM